MGAPSPPHTRNRVPEEIQWSSPKRGTYELEYGGHQIQIISKGSSRQPGTKVTETWVDGQLITSRAEPAQKARQRAVKNIDKARANGRARKKISRPVTNGRTAEERRDRIERAADQAGAEVNRRSSATDASDTGAREGTDEAGGGDRTPVMLSYQISGQIEVDPNIAAITTATNSLSALIEQLRALGPASGSVELPPELQI